MTAHKTRVLGALCGVALLIPATTALGAPTNPDPAPEIPDSNFTTTYFVDNRDGSGCSDEHPGTSTDAPLCSFDRFEDDPLGPGEALLVARDSVYNEPVTFRARGSEEAPALIDAYGEGERPSFVYDGTNNTTTTIARFLDPTHVTLRNLDFGNPTPEGRSAAHYGLRVDFTEMGSENVTIEDVGLYDNRVTGMFIRSLVNHDYTETVATGITVRGIDAVGNAHGVVLHTQGTVAGVPDPPTADHSANRVFTDVLIEDSRFFNNDNNNGDPAQVPAQIDAGCPDSLAVSRASDVTIRGNVFDGAAACRTNAGTAALYLGTVRDVRIVNNSFINTPNTQNPDMVAIDHEAGTAEVLIAGNYFADNYGGGVEYLAIHGATDFSTNNVTRANTFVRNGYLPNIPYLGGGAISQVGAGIVPDALIADNVAYEPHGLLNAHLDGDVRDFEVRNNLQLENPDWISFAARDFGDDTGPWRYEAGAAGQWSPLTLDSNGDYSDGEASISPYRLAASPSQSVALSWVAPRDGVVSLRGYPMAIAEATGIRVTRDDTQLTSIEVTDRGDVLVLDGIEVQAGEVLRFVAESGSAAVSLTPSVSYVGASEVTDEFGEWNFSVAGDHQGWASRTASSVTAGSLAVQMAATGAFIDSPSGLQLDADTSDVLRLRIANRSDLGAVRLHVRAPGEAFNTPRSVAFNINPRSTRERAEGFVEVLVDLSRIPDHGGEIDQVRLSFGAGSGEVLVDSIQFSASSGPRWDFDEADGWTFSSDMSCPSPGVPANDPVVEIDNSHPDRTWRQTAEISWNFGRMQTFTVPSGTLAQLDLWAYKVGNPQGCLFLRIVDEDRQQLFVGAIPPEQVSASGGWVSIHPGLTDLDPTAEYAVMIFSPYVTEAAHQYGIRFEDDARFDGGDHYRTHNGRATWIGPEGGGNRSVQFITYTAEEVTPTDHFAGLEPAPVSDGMVTGTSGYEPALISPDGLNLEASDSRYVHIRMSNPDNRRSAYLLFTTSEEPEFDVPRDVWPPGAEVDGRGLAFPLRPGPAVADYVLDMSHLDAWDGTIERLMVQPSFRWNYRIAPMGSTWSGAIDRVWIENGETVASVHGGEPSKEPTPEPTETPTPEPTEIPTPESPGQRPGLPKTSANATFLVPAWVGLSHNAPGHEISGRLGATTATPTVKALQASPRGAAEGMG